MIDLRSDTVTQPSKAMRDAMATADVGDDVYGEDPTVHRLEAEVCQLTKKEAALFVTSGSMGNQLAIACLTHPGDEVIVGEGAHPVFYEAGAGAALSGVQFATAGVGGLYTAEEMEAACKPRAYYSPYTSLVCVENTHNRGGGRIFPIDRVRAIAERAKSLGLALHLDGARLWNASAATGIAIAEWAAPFDTVSLCFSKGLGAPVGSVLAASRKTIERARRFRKMWGGGMRQSGILAAAALYALHNNVARLPDDHSNARRLAELLSIDPAQVETNIVNIDLPFVADTVPPLAKEKGLLISASGPKRLRAVTHLDVSRADIERAGAILLDLIRAR